MKPLLPALPLGMVLLHGCAGLEAERRAEEARLEHLRLHQPALYEIERAESRRAQEQGKPRRPPLGTP